jgi:hypothetical protein
MGFFFQKNCSPIHTWLAATTSHPPIMLYCLVCVRIRAEKMSIIILLLLVSKNILFPQDSGHTRLGNIRRMKRNTCEWQLSWPGSPFLPSFAGHVFFRGIQGESGQADTKTTGGNMAWRRQQTRSTMVESRWWIGHGRSTKQIDLLPLFCLPRKFISFLK